MALLLSSLPRNLYDLSEFYNYIEVALWPTLGIAIAMLGLRRRGIVRRDCLIAAGVLVIFGVSDWFEANTGNEWWHPWWLFTWKALCVLALLALIGRAWNRRILFSRRP